MRTYSQSFLYGGEADPKQMKSKFSEVFPTTMVQTVSSKAASNGFFIQMLAAQTLRAERSGSLLAKKPEIDFLLRLAGTSQISEAISKVGSRSGEPFVLVVASLRPLHRSGTIAGGRRLPARQLSKSELHRVEEGALLSAQRA
ncbi:MAG TPA: KEOPS complex subunit Cgi121 [Nitrososphaerales archaeon]|nr:KEOPS complex subunit Cgi121 [Nitrososphaerales archaeon]